MAFLTYRQSSTPTLPSSTTVKGSGLTNLEIDGNFKSLDDAKFEKNGGSLTGDISVSGDVTLTSGKTLKLSGASSGVITLNTVAAAGTNTITLPSRTGTLITSADTETISSTMLSTSGVTAGTYGSSTSIPTITVDSKGRITAASGNSVSIGNGTLTLNVSGTGLSGSQTFSANQTGNATFTVASNATSANTANAIVARDASGNFSAGTITGTLTGAARNLSSRGRYAETDPGNTRGPAGLSLYEAYANGYPVAYGNVIHLNGGGAGQLLIGWEGVDEFTSSSNWIRSKRDNDSTGWSPWALILTDLNYTTFVPVKNGAGAFGTWNISITGNAATSSNTNSISSAVGTNYTWTATQYFTGNGNTASTSNVGMQAYSTGGNGATMAFHRGGAYAVNMGLDSDNVFRIGGWSAAANRLQMDMSGNLTMSGNVTAYSDERLKKNWRALADNYVEKLSRIKHGIYDRIDEDLTQVGVSAQSLKELLPQAVSVNSDEMNTLSVNYGSAAMVSAVELAREVVDLKSKIAKLESLVQTLISK